MSYCVKCRAKTASLNELQLSTKNNRKMRKGECAVCRKLKLHLLAQASV